MSRSYRSTHSKIRQTRTKTITDPNSNDSFLTLDGSQGQLMSRGKSSQHDFLKQSTKTDAYGLMKRKKVDHINKSVTYLSKDNNELYATIMCSATEKRFRGRIKSDKQNIVKTTFDNGDKKSQKKLFSAVGEIYKTGKMYGRKKVKNESISRESKPLDNGTFFGQGTKQLCRRGKNNRHVNAASEPKIERTCVKLSSNREFLRLTEEKEWKAPKKTETRFNPTTTIIPAENESIPERLQKKKFIQAPTNIVNPESATKRNSSIRTCPQSYSKTTTVSHYDIMKEKNSRTEIGKRILDRSHPKSWIF